MAASSVFYVRPIKIHKSPLVMATSLIQHHIDMVIHGIMYQVFKQIDEIIKLMAYNKVQQAKELEVVRANSGENLVTNAP
ncbi:hypothetical protein MTR_3g008560 [Medicago truncatula]|uniref:Uncharacterized protein n=1 Tax=Medicago truncatula TaxID=3880 RepID=G7IYH2_MEDTR|nr:hypothetical protein MTR_3g008560 [Medicago truncatula]